MPSPFLSSEEYDERAHQLYNEGNYDAALDTLRAATKGSPSHELAREMGIAEACAIHYASVAVQDRFIGARDALLNQKEPTAAAPLRDACNELISQQREDAQRLYALQSRDARIGFEATNHYFYVPMDLVESVIDCEYLTKHWLAK